MFFNCKTHSGGSIIWWVFKRKDQSRTWMLEREEKIFHLWIMQIKVSWKLWRKACRAHTEAAQICSPSQVTNSGLIGVQERMYICFRRSISLRCHKPGPGAGVCLSRPLLSPWLPITSCANCLQGLPRREERAETTKLRARTLVGPQLKDLSFDHDYAGSGQVSSSLRDTLPKPIRKK